jgi:ABC-type microcin C transport system permease subunit YejB
MQFVSGVAAGVVATMGVAAAVFLGRTYLMPWIHRLTSDDVDISGGWSSSADTPSASYTYHISLRSWLGRWRGSATITRTTKSRAMDDYRHEFAVTARKRGSFVVVTLLGTRRNAASVATGLLGLERRGDALSGIWVYRPSISETPAGERVSFKRL